MVVPWLLMLVLLLNAPEVWYLRTPLIVLFAVGVVIRRWTYSASYWYVVAALLGTTVYVNWATSDNHKYLFIYAALTLCCVFSLPRQEQDDALALSSRWLIGLCMVLATAWKLANPQYLSGGFFTYELLADDRFAYVASWLGRVPAADLQANVELRELIVNGHLRGLDISTATLSTATGIRGLAIGLTVWTLLIEGLLAVLFLLPDGPRIAKVRNIALLVFGFSTYCVAPVRGFGWILMLLGLAQCREHERGFRLAYFIAFLAIQAYMIPAAGIVRLILSGG
jgi:hypothetical protein